MGERTVLGIDLGTTYSCVAHLDEYGKPVVLPNRDGKSTTPSVVYFEDAQNVVVGEQAKNEMAMHPDRVVSEIKRQMGKPDFFLDIEGRDYYPPQISAIILGSIVDDALEALNVEPPADGPSADVVITVPAYFGGAERAATKQAGELAGLNVLSIINEPTAAAIAYGLATRGQSRNVLVYDLGGGTFDVTIIDVSDAVIRAVATGGDRELGGADWDTRLVAHFLDRFEEQQPGAGDPRDDKEAVGELRLKAEQAKQGLTAKAKYGMSVTANLARAQFDVSREEFEKLTDDLIDRTLHQTEQVIAAALAKGMQKVDEVILVGGMSKMPAIGERLAERLQAQFPDLPPPSLQDPDQIVAKGAALFAAAQVSERYDPSESSDDTRPGPRGHLPGPTPQLVNITSKAYGVRAVRDRNDKVGYVSFIIDQNDELPLERRERYHTLFDNQTEVEIGVYEQDTEDKQEALEANKQLVEGMLTGLPPRKPAGQPVDVTFRLGDEGILFIRAESNGRELNLEYTLPGQVPAEELDKPLPLLAR